MPRLILTLLLLTSLAPLAPAQQGVLRPRQIVIEETSPTPTGKALLINNSTPSLRVQGGVSGADVGFLGVADATGTVVHVLTASQDETPLVLRDGALNLGVQLGFQTGGAGSLRLHSDPVGNSLLFKADDSTAGLTSMLIHAFGAALNINGSTTANGEIVLNPGAVSGNAKVIINAGHLGDHALSIEGITGQTARVFEINDSLGVRVFHVEGEASGAPGDMVSKNHFAVATLTHTLGSTVNAWSNVVTGTATLGLRPTDLGGTVGGTLRFANVTNNNYAQLIGVASSGNADIEMRSTVSVVDAFLPGDPNIDSLGLAAERWDAFIDDLNVVTCVGCGAASHPVADTTSIVEGSGDPTKEIRFEVDGLTTGTIRTLTVQNANYTLAGLDVIAQVFTVTQTFDGDIFPASGTEDIGDVAAPWDDIWFDGEIKGGGTVGADWIPDSDGARNLGTSAATWANVNALNFKMETASDVTRIEMNNTISSFTQFRINNDAGTRRIDIGIDANDASVSLISAGSRNVAIFTGVANTGLLVDNKLVVSFQQAAITDAPADLTYSANERDMIQDMCDAMAAHGLIAGCS